MTMESGSRHPQAWNERKKPFAWVKSAEQILAKADLNIPVLRGTSRLPPGLSRDQKHSRFRQSLRLSARVGAENSERGRFGAEGADLGRIRQDDFVLFFCIYWALRRVLELIVLLGRGGPANEIELLVLRHEVVVLRSRSRG